jgi:hypothetical protein
MTLVLARCLQCDREKKMILQNVQKSNNEKKMHCRECWKDECHYMTETRPWKTWKGMLDRIENPNTASFKHYGARGITVDPRWQNFKNFWADMQDGYADDLTIERNDVNGNYCKANCRWATNMEQQANKRNNRLVTYRGQEMHLAEFCRVAGVTKGGIQPYLNRHVTGDAAMDAYLKSSYPRWRVSRAGYKTRKKSTTS